MARDLRAIRKGFIPLPKQVYEPRTKVLIDNGGDDDIDVTSKLLGYQTTRTATQSIGQFIINLINVEGEWVDKFTSGNIVKIYFDYNPNPGDSFDATTLRFKGRIDKIGFVEDVKKGWLLNISGRDWPHLTDVTTSMTFNGVIASEALKSVIADINTLYTPNVFTTSNVITNNTAIYATFRNKSYWGIIRDICNRADMDAFIDIDGDLNAFDRDSKDDFTSYAVVGVNVKNVSSFGTDDTQVKNFVISRSEEDTLGFLWLSQDVSDQNNTWIKGGEMDDVSSSSIQEVQDKADMIKSRSLLTATKSGSLSIVGDYSLMPGYSIPSFVPKANVNGMMSVPSITDKYTVQRGLVTTLRLNELRRNTASLFVTTMNDIQNITTVSNPNKMRYSFLLKFNDESLIATLPTGMAISNGQLIMNATSDTLEVISTEFSSPVDATQAELLLNGEQISASSYRLTFDGATNEQSITPGTDNPISIISPGKKGRLTIKSVSNTFNVNPKWDTVIVRWK